MAPGSQVTSHTLWFIARKNISKSYCAVTEVFLSRLFSSSESSRSDFFQLKFRTDLKEGSDSKTIPFSIRKCSVNDVESWKELGRVESGLLNTAWDRQDCSSLPNGSTFQNILHLFTGCGQGYFKVQRKPCKGWSFLAVLDIKPSYSGSWGGRITWTYKFKTNVGNTPKKLISKNKMLLLGILYIQMSSKEVLKQIFIYVCSQ